MPRSVKLTLIGKPDCHLCEDARHVVDSVVTELEPNVSAPAIEVEELSILDDAALDEKYRDEIPVLLVDGRVHNIWRIDPERLRNTLLEVS